MKRAALPVCCRCGERKLPEEMAKRGGGKLDPRCKACNSEWAAISQAARSAKLLPLEKLERKIRTTKNLLATLEAVYEMRTE